MRNITYILALLFLTSCTEIIDIELKNTGDSRLVVFSEFTDQYQVQTVRLSKTTAFLDSTIIPTVSNAKLFVSWDGGTIELDEITDNPGYYQTNSPFKVEPSTLYTLHISEVDVNNDGTMESYTASDMCLQVTEIDSIKIGKDLGDTNDDNVWDIKLYAVEPGNETNYYYFETLINNEKASYSVNDWWVTDDRYFNGSSFAGAPVQVNEFEIPNEETPITLRMVSISKKYYEFLIAAQIESGAKVPLFSGPPANLPTNLSNGALGYFSVQSVATSTTSLNPNQAN